MPLTEKQKKLLLAGGLITVGGITAYAVAKALAKPPEAVPPPEEVPPTYPPAIIEFRNLPMTIEQYYHCILSGVIPFWQHFDEIRPYKNPECTQTGWTTRTIIGKVLDAMGRGVPNVRVQVWSSPPDQYAGMLFLNGAERTAENPLVITTDANGEFKFMVEYLTDFYFLAKHGCKGCTAIGCETAEPCYTLYPMYGMWFSCGYKTPGAIYQLTARIEGTVLTTIGLITAYANLIG